MNASIRIPIASVVAGLLLGVVLPSMLHAEDYLNNGAPAIPGEERCGVGTAPESRFFRACPGRDQSGCRTMGWTGGGDSNLRPSELKFAGN